MVGPFVGDLYALKYAIRELPVIDKVLNYVGARDRVLQAGGSLGVFPARLAECFQHVMTFEADADNFAMLRRNATASNIAAVHAALGASAGSVGLSHIRRDGKTHNHPGIVHVSGDGDVPMVCIDDLHLSACDAILLDIEGYELFALRGAVQTIARCRPVIALEVNKNLGFVGLTETDVARFFHHQRYHYVAQSGSDRIYVPTERATCH